VAKKTRTKKASTTRRPASGGASGNESGRGTGKGTRKATSKQGTTRKRTTRAAATPARGSSAKKGTTRKATTKKKKATAKKATAKRTTSKVVKKVTKKKVAPKATAPKKTAPKKTPSTSKRPAGRSTNGSAGSSGASTGKTKRAAGTGAKAGTAESTPPAKGRTKDSGKSSTGGRRSGRSVSDVARSSQPDQDGYAIINGRRVRIAARRADAPPPSRTSKSRSAAPAEAETPAPKAKKVKTKLTRKELTKYRTLLMLKRAEILGDLTTMEQLALRSGGGESMALPTHMADLGSDTYEQGLMLNLAENERTRLIEIADALERMEEGTYGVCAMTFEQIPKARLDAKPWAKYTIEAARRIEAGYPA